MPSKKIFMILLFLTVTTLSALSQCQPNSGGNLNEGDICGGDVTAECGPGLTCCYPCGIEGCDFVCTKTCRESDPGCVDGCYMYP